MKNGHLKVHIQSTVKNSYSPESFIIITCTCVLLTMSDIGKDCLAIFQMERLVSLKIILHGESFISDPFYCPFFKHYFDDYSNFF